MSHIFINRIFCFLDVSRNKFQKKKLSDFILKLDKNPIEILQITRKHEPFASLNESLFWLVSVHLLQGDELE